MGRRPKTPAAANGATKTKTVGESIEQTARMNRLTDRERSLALLARQRKLLKFPAKLDEFEQILEWCETWDEDVQTVVRACFRIGFEHCVQFVSNGAPYSPFARYSFTPRPPGQVDPSGRAFPPPQVPPSFTQPPQQGRPPVQQSPMNFRPPQPRETYSESVEPVYAGRGQVKVGNKMVPMDAVLPSGATDDIQRAAPQTQQYDLPQTQDVQQLGVAIAQTIAALQDESAQAPPPIVPAVMEMETVVLEQEPVPATDADPLADGVTSASDLAATDEDISDLL